MIRIFLLLFTYSVLNGQGISPQLPAPDLYWVLCNNWLEVKVAKATGEILSLNINGKNLLDKPATIIIHDQKTKK